MRRLRRPSPAFVLASVAVFVAIGGSATAASLVTSKQIKDNSVRSRDLRNNSVLGRDLRNGSVTGADVRNRSLTGSDFKAGQLPSSTVTYQTNFGFQAPGQAPSGVTATCPAGTSPTGGSATYLQANGGGAANVPTGGSAIAFDSNAIPTGWTGYQAPNTTGTTLVLATFVICGNADFTPPGSGTKTPAQRLP